MRGLAIIIVALVMLSATVREQSRFVPRPAEPLPAVNVPWLLDQSHEEADGAMPAGFFCGGTGSVGCLSEGHDDVQLDQIDQLVIWQLVSFGRLPIQDHFIRLGEPYP